MSSLRSQLLLHLPVILLITIGVCGAILHIYLRHVLFSSFDVNLLAKAEVLANTIEIQPNGTIDLESIETDFREYESDRKSEYFEIWDLNGAVVARSPSLAGRDLPKNVAIGESPSIRPVVLPNGRAGRAVYLEFLPRPADEIPSETGAVPTLILALAAPSYEVTKSLGRVSNGLVLIALVLVLAVPTTVWWLVYRGLSSLDKIGEQAKAITANTMSFRFESQDLPEELLPITRRLNDLLDRLQRAFVRERRFTADAAHELRTPIAELRTLAEVGMRESAITGLALDGYFRDILDVAQHLETLVAALLALARCESGLQPVSLRTVDLVRLVEDVWRSVASGTGGKGYQSSLDFEQPAWVQSDPDLLRAILTNIFSNAVLYVAECGRIEVVIARQGNAWAVQVRNTVSGLHSEDVQSLFKPFWRKDQNSGAGSNIGLGLSLVAAYASLLGIEVRAAMQASDVLLMEVICPAATAPVVD